MYNAPEEQPEHNTPDHTRTMLTTSDPPPNTPVLPEGPNMTKGGIGHWLGRLADVVLHADMKGVELVFSVLKLGWGIFLLIPIVSLGQGLRVFGYIVPEIGLGIWLAVIGATQLYGLLCLSLFWRTVATLMALPTWLLLTTSIIVAAPRSTLWVLMAVLSLTNIWLYYRLRLRRGPA